MSETYIYPVIIPEGVSPGDTFETTIGNSAVTIRCPTNTSPGTIIHVKNQSNDEIEGAQSNRIFEDNTTAWFLWIPFTYMCLNILLFVLFTVSFSLPSLAVQIIR